jgi:S-DNA-T family DNA segregation ATPase FtsK/SpoIIIE
MFNRKDIKKLEQKIDELSEKVRAISERQNSQYTDIMMQLNELRNDLQSIFEKPGPYDHFSDEELYKKVRTFAIEVGKISTSAVQRKFKLGFVRANRLIDMLEDNNVISPPDGAKPRKVLIKK